MANTYTYTGPGTRWAEQNPTAVDLMNIARVNADHLHEALNTLMDSDAADGALLSTVLMTIIEMTQSITTAISITASRNALSAGPVTVAIGGSVTVPITSNWRII